MEEIQLLMRKSSRFGRKSLESGGNQTDQEESLEIRRKTQRFQDSIREEIKFKEVKTLDLGGNINQGGNLNQLEERKAYFKEVKTLKRV